MTRKFPTKKEQRFIEDHYNQRKMTICVIDKTKPSRKSKVFTMKKQKKIE